MPEPRIPIQPEFFPPLDPFFYPAALFNRAYREELYRTGQGVPLVLGLERADGTLSRYATQVFAGDHPWAIHNAFYVERILKFLLWQRGGWKVYVGGPEDMARHIQSSYAPQGARAFDYHFMGEDVYQRPFSVFPCRPDEVPEARESQQSSGGTWMAAASVSTWGRRTSKFRQSSTAKRFSPTRWSGTRVARAPRTITIQKSWRC